MAETFDAALQQEHAETTAAENAEREQLEKRIEAEFERLTAFVSWLNDKSSKPLSLDVKRDNDGAFIEHGRTFYALDGDNLETFPGHLEGESIKLLWEMYMNS